MPASDMKAVPPGEDPVIGGRDVGVGADHQGGAAVEMMGERLFLARRLGVDVDHDGVGDLRRAGRPRARGRPPRRVVERVHEQAAHDVDHQDARAARGYRSGSRRAPACRADSWPGRSRRGCRSMNTSVSRWSQAWLPSVMASAPAARGFVADALGDAEAAGGVLAVDHHAIEAPALAQGRQALGMAVRPGRPTISPRNRRRIQDTPEEFRTDGPTPNWGSAGAARPAGSRP